MYSPESVKRVMLRGDANGVPAPVSFSNRIVIGAGVCPVSRVVRAST